MPHKISILVHADVSREDITLEVSGHLSVETMPTLECQVQRARALDPAAPVRVDLSTAHPIDPDVHEALYTLTESTSTDPFAHGGRVEIVGAPSLSLRSSGAASGEVVS